MSAVCIRLDDVTKDGLDRFCESVGLSLSAIFTLFAKKVVNEGRIPFEICTPQPNMSTRKAIEEGERLALDGKPGYSDLSLMWSDLEK